MPTGDIHIRFNEKDWATIQARARLEMRPNISVIRSAIMFYAKYGPWKMANETIEINNKPHDVTLKV